MNCSVFRRFKCRITEKGSQIFFPFDRLNFAFDYSKYDPGMTDYKLSRLEVHEFFVKIYQATDSFEALRDCCEPKSYALLLFLPLSIVASGIYTCLVDVDRTQDKVMCQSFTLLLSIIVMLMLLSCFKTRIKKYKTARNTIETVIVENQDFYAPKGLKWELADGSVEYIILTYDQSIVDQGTTIVSSSIERQPEDTLLEQLI